MLHCQLSFVADIGVKPLLEANTLIAGTISLKMNMNSLISELYILMYGFLLHFHKDILNFSYLEPKTIIDLNRIDFRAMIQLWYLPGKPTLRGQDGQQLPLILNSFHLLYSLKELFRYHKQFGSEKFSPKLVLYY